uniref:Amino acid permease n=1 Tax=Thermofilum pendens TaxID=2269 RepID=A0A7C3SLA3_THEPE
MPEELKRDLGLLLLTGIGVGAMVGSGVYALPGLVASVSGPLSILAVLAMSAITGLFVYILAELGRELPRSGALYYFARESFGDLAGFITGFSFYVSCFVGTAAIIYSFVLYASFFAEGLAVGLTLTPLGTALALLLLAVVTAVNVLGVKHGALLNLALTVLRVIPLLLFIGVGLLSLRPANLEPLAPYGYGSIALAIAFGFWMFVGFESLVLVGDEVRRPAETIRKSALATVLGGLSPLHPPHRLVRGVD